MLSLLMVTIVCVGGFEAGADVGVVFPSSGLETNHAFSALFGVTLAHGYGPGRVALDYGYAGLTAKQGSPYRFDIHELLLGYDYEFFRRRAGPDAGANWGFDASAAAGYSLLARTLGSARETGRAPAGRVGIGFFQRQGHSRLSLGLDNLLFLESAQGGGTSHVTVAWLIGIKGGVSYVF